VLGACRKKLGIDVGGTTADGKFSLVEVECLGACVNAPVVQVGDDYYEDLDAASTERLLDDLAHDRAVAPGPRVARTTSAPAQGRATLLDGKDR
jgi:(2Fe-2S) ferredoxin